MNGHSDEAIRATTPQTDEEWLSAMQDAADDEREAEWQEAHGDAQTHEEWMTFRNQTYYAGVTERLNAMNDAELEAAYEQAVRELRERQEEVMQERRAGYWMDAPQMSREHQMVCAEYHNRLYGDDQRDEDASGYSATVADGLERWTR